MVWSELLYLPPEKNHYYLSNTHIELHAGCPQLALPSKRPPCTCTNNANLPHYSSNPSPGSDVPTAYSSYTGSTASYITDTSSLITESMAWLTDNGSSHTTTLSTNRLNQYLWDIDAVSDSSSHSELSSSTVLDHRSSMSLSTILPFYYILYPFFPRIHNYNNIYLIFTPPLSGVNWRPKSLLSYFNPTSKGSE